MKVRVVALLVLLSGLVALPAGAREDKKDSTKEKGKTTQFDQFKQLAGEWIGKGSHDGKEGPDFKVKYKVTSNGSAVVETIMPDTDNEMISVIHPDGDKLILTHYCAIGNQPCMKAENKSEGNKVAFEFTHATNMKSDKDFHMHSVTFTFVDKDTLKAEWTHYNDGKPNGNVVFELKRKK